MAEQFPNERKVPRKIAMSPDPGFMFFLLLGNHSAIFGLKSEVRDEMSATILEKRQAAIIKIWN